MPDSSNDLYYRILRFGIPALLFALFFNLAILDPTNIGWLLRGDWAQHFLGWHAYRNGADGLNHQNLLAHPSGLSVLYTDSNPLMSLPLKLISPLLPADFQFIGLWFLLCLCLHYFIALKLVSRYAPGRWYALGGALLLCLLPTLYNRIGHDTLFAHWLILWALYIFFEIPDERRRQISWAVLLTVCALVHPYILVMCLFIWAADQAASLRDIWRDRDVSRGLRLMVAAGLAAAFSLTGMWAAGGFAGSSAAADGFGMYSMGLDALFNPSGIPGLFAFLPKQKPQQAFEGFQYLGAGLLFLIGAAWWLSRRNRRKSAEPVAEIPSDRVPDGPDDMNDWPAPAAPDLTFRRAHALKWALITLTILAVSNKIQIFGLTLIDLPVPDIFSPVLGIIRASGRLFWPVAYALVFLSLLTVYRLPQRQWLMIVAIALQLLDAAALSTHIKTLTHRASNRHSLLQATSPQWDQLIRASRRVDFVPPDTHINEAIFYEITYRAVSARVPINTMYAARPNPEQEALEFKAYQAFRKGVTQPDHLYVFLNPCEPHPSLRNRLRELDGIWFIPPASLPASIGRTPTIAALPANTLHPVTRKTPAACLLNTDWALGEEDGVWTLGDRANLTLPATTVPGTQLRLTLNTRRPSQLVILINGQRAGVYATSKKSQDISLILPANAQGPHTVTFLISNPPPPGKPVEKARRRLKLSRLGLFSPS